MIHKRPFVGDDSYEVAFKYPRNLEHVDKLAPIVSFNDYHQKTTISGKKYLACSFMNC